MGEIRKILRNKEAHAAVGINNKNKYFRMKRMQKKIAEEKLRQDTILKSFDDIKK